VIQHTERVNADFLISMQNEERDKDYPVSVSLDQQCHIPSSKQIRATGNVCNDKPVFAHPFP